MDQITLKANINECIVENWQSNTGEVNARVMNIEMCEDLCSCARQFVTFELADGTVYESLVVDGKAKIPIIEKPQFIKIGLYAENSDGEKRYSSRPANVYVNAGSYPDGSVEPPKPTPGDYAELLEQIADLEKGTIKTLTSGTTNLWELESGLYRVPNYVTVKASTSETLDKPAKSYAYLYVSGRTYTGSTDKSYIVGWLYIVSTLYDNRFATKIFTGATYTDGRAREVATELATVTKLNNLEERLDTKLKNVATKDYVNEQLGVIDNGLY